MHYEGNVLVVDPGEVVDNVYPWQTMWGSWNQWGGYGGGPLDRGWRGGTFAGVGNDCSGCATPIDPRSAPVWSNTYRLASAAALNRVPTVRALGAVELGSTGIYLLALAVPAVVIASLFFMGVIKVD